MRKLFDDGYAGTELAASNAPKEVIDYVVVHEPKYTDTF
jgi:hypothetical protein